MSLDLRRKIAARRRIYLLRHGDVSYFDARGAPYPPDSVPLNDQGIAQCEAAREALSAVPIDRVVVSGHPRTRQTAEIVARGRGLAVETCPDLAEIAPGRFPAEASKSELEAYFTGALAGGITRETRFLGGETFGDLIRRVVPAFEGIISSTGWKHLLIVAHGGVNRAILLHALRSGLESLGRLEQEAGCINVIDVHAGGEILVRQVNYTPYAPLKEEIWTTTMERIFLEHYDAAGPPAGEEESV